MIICDIHSIKEEENARREDNVFVIGEHVKRFARHNNYCNKRIRSEHIVVVLLQGKCFNFARILRAIPMSIFCLYFYERVRAKTSKIDS